MWDDHPRKCFFLHGIEVLGVMANTKVTFAGCIQWSKAITLLPILTEVENDLIAKRKTKQVWGNSFATSMILGRRVPLVLSKVLVA